MIKLEVKWLHSPDLLDPEENIPENPEQFRILVQAMIGVEDEEGEDSFDFLVCTPSWLANALQKESYIWGRHYLFVPKYDYELILNTIKQLCDTIEASDWETAAQKLARYGHWEFEDYQEFEDYEAATAPDLVGVK